MPRLLDPSTIDRAVPRQAGVVQLPVTQQSDAVGQGLINLGTGIEQGTEQLYRAQKIEDDRVNKLRAEEAVTKLRTRQLDLSFGEQNGYERMKGSAAVTRPILPEWTKRFEDAEKEINGELSNDTQRTSFKASANVSRLQFQEGIMRHLAKEGDTYAKEVFDGTVKTEQQNAAARWNSPNDVGVSLARIDNAVEERADRYSWPSEYKDVVRKQEQGSVHAAVIGQAIANGNFRYAEEWFNKNRDNIDPTTSKQLAVAVQNGTQKELVNTYNAEYLSNEDSMPALEGLRKRVLSDQVLDEDRRNVLVGRIQNRQAVLDNRIQIQNDRRLKVLERGINELNSNTLAGFEPNANQFAPLLEAAKGTELEAQAQAALKLADTTRQFRNAPPIVQEQMLTNAESAIRQDPTKFDRNVLGAWRQISENQRKQATEAPVKFMVRQGVIEAPTPVDLSQPQDAGPALQERFSVARAASTFYQVPFKPLDPEEVSLLRSTLDAMPTSVKRDYFGKLAVASGTDTAGYMAIMGQLAPDQPVTAIAGALSGKGNNLAADLALRGQAILQPPNKSDGKPDTGALLPLPPEQDFRTSFDSEVREAFAGKAKARSDHYQTAKAIYAAMSVDAGDKDTKVFNRDRWEKSIEMAIGPIEKYNGRRTIIPQGYDYDQFRDALADRVESLQEKSLTSRTRSFYTQKSGGEVKPGNDFELDPYWTTKRLMDLPLEAQDDGRYAFRSGDGIVTDNYGRPVIIDFSRPGRIKTPEPYADMPEGGYVAP